jgi:hypothetical protein
MLVLGLIVGRAWAVLLGAVVWAAVLLASGTIGVSETPGAAGLAAANVAVGVLMRWAVVWPLRKRLDPVS